MPANTTAKSLPYPLATDAVTIGSEAVRKLAQSVDNMVQSGSVLINVATGGGSTSATVTFPVAYASPPIVVATVQANSAVTTNICAAAAATTTSVSLSASRATAGNSTVLWVAVGPVATVT